MKWIDFRDELVRLGLLIFNLREGLRILGAPYVSGKTQISRWVHKGYLIRLKNGLYALSDLSTRGRISDYLIANKLYYPSYVSMEAALGYYGLIPEVVFNITSVTSKPTRRFRIDSFIYTYRTLKPKGFTGYVVKEEGDLSFRIAEPEKALVDYLYFSLIDKTSPSERVEAAELQRDKVFHYASLFNNRRLNQLIEEILC